MRPYKEIFNQTGLLPNKPKYGVIRDFYEHVFADPQDQDHGLDAMVVNSLLQLWKGVSVSGDSSLIEKLAENMGVAYETIYLPIFTYYAKTLERLVKINQLPGNIVFLERDARHLADVARLLPDITGRVKTTFWPRSISSGHISDSGVPDFVDLEKIAVYQKQIFGGATVIADTGMYGIQAMSLHTGRNCFHYEKTGQYWGGLTNADNVPQPLLDGLFAGSKLLPIFLISSTHWQEGFQIPGVLNHLVYQNKFEIVNFAKKCGVNLDTEEKQENFVRQLLSLALDSIERLLPSPYANSGIYDSETSQVKVMPNDSPAVLAILKNMKKIRERYSEKIVTTSFDTSEAWAISGMKNLIEFSTIALSRGIFTGVLPIGVPGKYAGNESQIIDEIPKGGKESHLASMARMAMGNSVLYPPGPAKVLDLPLPEAERLVAQNLFNNFMWP